MAKLLVDGPDLVVGLSWLEKVGAVHRNVRVRDADATLAAIRGATGV
jgi:hypothetical protein